MVLPYMVLLFYKDLPRLVWFWLIRFLRLILVFFLIWFFGFIWFCLIWFFFFIWIFCFIFLLIWFIIRRCVFREVVLVWLYFVIGFWLDFSVWNLRIVFVVIFIGHIFWQVPNCWRRLILLLIIWLIFIGC